MLHISDNLQLSSFPLKSSTADLAMTKDQMMKELCVLSIHTRQFGPPLSRVDWILNKGVSTVTNTIYRSIVFFQSPPYKGISTVRKEDSF